MCLVKLPSGRIFINTKRLEDFGGYRKARELFRFVVEDFGPLAQDMRWCRLVSQQVASANSICANIEEGHGQGRPKTAFCSEVIAILTTVIRSLREKG